MSGLLGALSGLGQGMAQTGNTLFNNELDKMKEARLNAIRQQERAEDRQFAVEDRNQMREWQLGDMDTQRGWQVEDRDFAAQHATQLAGMRSSGGSGSGKLPPQAKAALDLMEHLRRKSEFGELSPDEQAQYQQASRQYELFTGLAQFGAMMNTGDTNTDTNTDTDDTDYDGMAERVRNPQSSGLLGGAVETQPQAPQVNRTGLDKVVDFVTPNGTISRAWDKFTSRPDQSAEQAQTTYRAGLQNGFRNLTLEQAQEIYPLLNPSQQQRLQNHFSEQN